MSAPTPRTTIDLVAGIVGVQAGVDANPFIAAANDLVTGVCSAYSPPYTDGYVGSRMELIERWVAAHLYTVFDNQLTMAKAGTVAVGYQYKVDFGLRSSMYGQQAMLLDIKGGLAKLDNSVKTKRNIKVGLSWGGRHYRWWSNWDYWVSSQMPVE